MASRGARNFAPVTAGVTQRLAEVALDVIGVPAATPRRYGVGVRIGEEVPAVTIGRGNQFRPRLGDRMAIARGTARPKQHTAIVRSAARCGHGIPPSADDGRGMFGLHHFPSAIRAATFTRCPDAPRPACWKHRGRVTPKAEVALEIITLSH